MPSNQEIERETFAENAETRVPPTQFPTMPFIIKEVPSAPHSRMKERQVNQVLSSLQILANSVPSASLQLAHFVYPCAHLPTHYRDSSLQTCPVVHLHRCSLLRALHLMWWPTLTKSLPFFMKSELFLYVLQVFFSCLLLAFLIPLLLRCLVPRHTDICLVPHRTPPYIFPLLYSLLLQHPHFSHKKKPVNSLNELRIFFPKESV